ATIMGSQTFGKGSVQTVRPLGPDTGIKLTTARYYTPNGRSIQAKGIVPDIVVEESANGSTGMRLREVDLDRHLNNDKDVEIPAMPADAGAKGKPGPAKEDEDGKQAAPFEFATKTDYQFTQALNLLKGLQIMQKN
ncbi:MAG: S41 family peptidase, partial [Methyloversatilis sp.]|nr:S41 family peptidase [Methyloversatilis sp.]